MIPELVSSKISLWYALAWRSKPVPLRLRWQSFHRGGSVSIYVLLYALGFLMSSLSTLNGMIPVFIYLCYMSVIILGVYFAMGTVGFLSSYLVVYYIFKAVKSD